MCRMWERYSKKELNVRKLSKSCNDWKKILREWYRMWKNFVRDMLSAECEKTFWRDRLFAKNL